MRHTAVVNWTEGSTIEGMNIGFSKIVGEEK